MSAADPNNAPYSLAVVGRAGAARMVVIITPI